MSISITTNAADVARLLDQVPGGLDTAMRGTLEDSSTLFLGTMSRYPAPPPSSTYRRTRTLGRSWSRRPITKTGNGWRVIVGSNGNMAPYNRFVQDRLFQARIHQGRWTTAQTAVEQSASQVQRFADARIRAALGGL